MAGGNLSPRQKMINLMYLIFIAMLALNMSKEVLSAFGLMNEKLTESNEAAAERNAAFMAGLEQKASEQPAKYEPLKAQASQIKSLANNFDAYLESLKTKMIAKIDNPTDYEIMDKGDYLDENFFKGDIIKPDGKEFLSQIATFRDGVVKVLSNQEGMEAVIDDVKKKFNTDAVKRGAGKVEWLDHNFKGFPLVASLTKMTQLQSDIKTTESEVMSTMLKGTLTSEVSMTNYTTLLETTKSAYFNGEQFDGQIVLGRKDNSTKPNRVELTLDGRKLSDKEYAIEEGKVKLKVGTGSVGEHKIGGKLIFVQDGEEVEVPVEQSFATVAKPNAATISADKMNVVYRGVKNPMTISFAGIADNNVKANAPGLTKVNGIGKYVMDATQIKGREVTINVTGVLDGKSIPDNATFRIKDLPKPTGTVRGEDGSLNMQRNSLEISTIGAKFDDFDFELPLSVTGFKFKVPGQPTIEVNGNKLDTRAKQALSKAKRGSGIQIFDIEAKAQGVSVILKKVSPVFIELTN
ncbi:MAG: gliding motility protein GldM [Flavobacteriales bacterium]|nr:gliding motility protein GldM [Flavobacteriia bacterium]NCP05960.1 gliding motility protein GldM [Flavobacteriales bacterium]PIV94409.1 MAG: gliding motility protein GldM [Flavobacteriaceae bacterium CG17_big_fil_post_rev_8_21_14_2_50_33_15]PIY10017.1 MAG: gliding motility protein GldM [Flavobacteriaceae bacterium CG_4_10_14_3_um_filter_33_47]PJB17590.1 MAG: gliding motility protein GldM [Flavobacteriaceae bacterium CG_4_9_14_3_um_filter_33_16]